ncbi:UNVERIFIED_CONTAM: hypothetical protein FKN15_036960 [Acipenser sinensis]
MRTSSVCGPGVTNWVVDLLSRRVPNGSELRLVVVSPIWERRWGPAGNRCLGTPVTERTVIYAFPPPALLPLCLEKNRQDRAKALLVDSLLAQETLVLNTDAPPERPAVEPKSRDLLSQAWGTLWHPNPSSLKLWIWP